VLGHLISDRTKHAPRPIRYQRAHDDAHRAQVIHKLEIGPAGLFARDIGIEPAAIALVRPLA